MDNAFCYFMDHYKMAFVPMDDTGQGGFLQLPVIELGPNGLKTNGFGRITKL